MKVRDEMREKNENLEWCKPYVGQRVAFAIDEGQVASLMVDGKDIMPRDKSKPGRLDYTRDQIMLAALVNGGQDGPDPVEALLSGEAKECACRDCPWFDACDAMDEDIEEF